MTTFDKILVTGGLGFMGSDFVRYVNEASPSMRIIVLDSYSYAGTPMNLASEAAMAKKVVQKFPGLIPNVTVAKGSILDPWMVEDYVKQVDLVVHFAAETHNDKALEDPRVFAETNYMGTLNVLEAVRKYGVRLHHVSTDEVFGGFPIDTDVVLTEASAFDPANPYSASKAASDLLVKAWARTFGVRVTISNSTNNFGPRQNIEKFIPRQIVRLATGRKAVLYGEGANMRNWLYVRDHSRAVWDIIQQGAIGESYIVSGDDELSNQEVLGLILSKMDKSWDDVEEVPDRVNHDVRYPVDSSKLRDELGWHPEFGDFERQLQTTIDWYLDNRFMWEEDAGSV